jgi:hypothetical protein
MYLIQLLIPLADNAGRRFPQAQYTTLSEELTERFGGLTAYSRSPAVGLWQPDDSDQRQRDDVIAYEVLAETLDRDWWASYRAALQRRFEQEEIMIRAHEVHRL